MIYNSVAEIYEAAQKTRVKLLAKSENLTLEQLNVRENGEGWSVAEILEHIAMVEGNVIKAIEKFLPKVEAAASEFDGTFNPPLSFLEQAKLAKDTKFEAPVHVHPQGSQDLDLLLKALTENRVRLNKLRSRLETKNLSNLVFPHPAFGNLSVYQWLVVIGLHEYRHLAQIDRILENIN